MAIPVNTKVRLWGVFTRDGRLNKPLDTAVDVYIIDGGLSSKVVTDGTPTESGDKFYYDYITEDDIEDVHATFKTSDGMVDFLEVPSLGMSLEKIVSDFTSWMTPYGHIVLGRGRGEYTYTDNLIRGGHPAQSYVVKAYRHVTGTTNWNTLYGQDKTDANGTFVLYLDGGQYMLSFEKNGVQYDTELITVS